MADKPHREKKPPIVSALDPNMPFKDALGKWCEGQKQIVELTAKLAVLKADKALTEGIIFPKIKALASRKVLWKDGAMERMVSIKTWMVTTHPWKQVYTQVYSDLLTEEQRVEADKVVEDKAKPSERNKLVLEGYEEVVDADSM